MDRAFALPIRRRRPGHGADWSLTHGVGPRGRSRPLRQCQPLEGAGGPDLLGRGGPARAAALPEAWPALPVWSGG